MGERVRRKPKDARLDPRSTPKTQNRGMAPRNADDEIRIYAEPKPERLQLRIEKTINASMFSFVFYLKAYQKELKNMRWIRSTVSSHPKANKTRLSNERLSNEHASSD